MSVIARTAAGVESTLLVNSSGALVTSATALMALGEMKLWLVDPGESWVKLDGSRIDASKHPALAEKFGDKALPKIDYMWAYTG